MRLGRDRSPHTSIPESDLLKRLARLRNGGNDPATAGPSRIPDVPLRQISVEAASGVPRPKLPDSWSYCTGVGLNFPQVSRVAGARLHVTNAHGGLKG